MSRFKGQSLSFSKDLSKSLDKYYTKKTGVLLVNLGTPVQPTPSALRRYLREFLSDPRVVEIPRLLWLAILHGIILRVRPKKSAKLYQNIWTDAGSPLLVISQQQKIKITKALSEKFGDNIIVSLAMRYGQPSIKNELNKFRAANIDNLVILPLYPQYSGPTTGSTFDAIVTEIKRWRWIPSLHFINGYHHQPLYIKALAKTVTDYIKHNGKPDKLVISYHGMPKLFHQWGDPYADFCQQTTQLLQDELALNDNEYITTYQSRFGKAEWLMPYTSEVLEKLPQQGNKHVAVICPAFSADCLETLDEIKREYKQLYLKSGGEKFEYIAALNDNDEHIYALVDVISPYLT